MKKLPHYDQEYLRTMAFETTGQRSIKNSGRSFNQCYKNASNFSLFNSEEMMINYMGEFMGKWEHAASHLLNGKKYFFSN